MKYYSIALLVFVALLVGIDFIEVDNDSALGNVKENQDGRYIIVFLVSCFVLYTEYNGRKISNASPRLPTYEETMSSTS
jgi:hypothetical protein